jgi:hypothetical protein
METVWTKTNSITSAKFYRIIANMYYTKLHKSEQKDPNRSAQSKPFNAIYTADYDWGQISYYMGYFLVFTH